MDRTEGANIEAVVQVGEAWATAELAHDIAALERLLTDDFVCVGPFGFVLTKQQFLQPRQSGDLRHTAFAWSEPQAHAYGDTVIVVGRQYQRSTFQGNDASGEFRVTQVIIANGDTWRIASLHYSPIAQPPGSKP